MADFSSCLKEKPMPETNQLKKLTLLRRAVLERGESLITRISETLRNMTTITRTVGILSIIAITLVSYGLGKGNVFKRRGRKTE